MVASSAAIQMSSTNKFEFMKYKFVVLRDNLKAFLDFLHSVGDHTEEQMQCYQVMQIKTNFFIDEIDFHLRGDVNIEMLKEYFVAYAKFYQRSRNELTEVLSEMCPNRHLVW